MQEYCERHEECRHAQLLRYFGEEWAQQRCSTACDVCRGEAQPIGAAEAKGGRSRASKKGSKLAGAAAKPAAFQKASALFDEQQQQQQQQQQQGQPSFRALKMQQAAVDSDGWRFKKGGKENPAAEAAAAASAGFVTAAQLATQQQRQPKPARGGGGRTKKGGGAAVGAQKNTILSMFTKQ